MPWNWQQPNWPNFVWDEDKLARAEILFAENAGIAIGTTQHLDDDSRETLTIEIMSGEACDTSAIEGEVLDRDSVQSSIRRHLGLKADRRARPAEAGIAEMMVDLYRNLASPLDHETLFGWHRMVMNGRRDLADIGGYRRHDDPMQIVSGPVHRPRIHFEAPPSERMTAEMDRFLAWFQDTMPAGPTPLPAITRAGISHIWFESLHPFEDGNGRIGRAIVGKALSQGLSTPALTAVAGTLLERRKAYYQALEAASHDLDVTDWLTWFADAVIEAQQRSLTWIRFILDKTRLLGRVRDQLNTRQEKAVLRMFEAGPEGFVGGMSAGNYMSITGAPSATATRDLADLVERGVLRRTGERKATRYYLIAPALEGDRHSHD
jgi:Fic family protein